jgi:hypothetical protein
MRTRALVGVVVLATMMTVGVAGAAPPTEKAATAVASRWLEGVKAGAGRKVAALVERGASVHGAPCVVHDATGRAEIAKAVPAWRYCLEFVPQWKTVEVGPDWREVETSVSGESFGTLRIRVARSGRIRDVVIWWSQGGV